MLKIDAIIPCKDEPTVEEVVEKVTQLPFIKQTILIDDGSKKEIKINTEKIKTIRLEPSQGKTKAVLEGLKYTTTEFILLQDADLEYPVENVEKLYTHIPEYHMVIAKRFVPIDKITISGVLANKLIIKILKEQDVFSGQRIVHRKLLEQIKPTGKWKLETSLLLQAKKTKSKVKYVDCLYYPRSYKEGKKIKPWDMIEILWEVFKDGLASGISKEKRSQENHQKDIPLNQRS